MKYFLDVGDRSIDFSYSVSVGHISQSYQYTLNTLKVSFFRVFSSSKLSYEQRVREICQNILELTHREIDCYLLLVKGSRPKEIGKILGISYRTVEKHLENIRIKLQCKTFAEVINVISQCLYDEIS